MRARWGVNPAVVDKAIRKAELAMRRPVSQPAEKSKASKYRNKRTTVGAHTFDSKKEAGRYQELVLLEKAGRIHGLARQSSFELVANGMTICRYVADFTYYEGPAPKLKSGDRLPPMIVEDCKGMRTAVYKLKKKLMLALLGIDIKET